MAYTIDIGEIMNTNNLLKLINKFAQLTSAQPGEIQNVLHNAKLWDKSQEVSPLLSQVGVPDDASVSISIIANKGPAVNFHTELSPENKILANKLNLILKNKYSPAMSNALKPLTIETPVLVKWLTY